MLLHGERNFDAAAGHVRRVAVLCFVCLFVYSPLRLMVITLSRMSCPDFLTVPTKLELVVPTGLTSSGSASLESSREEKVVSQASRALLVIQSVLMVVVVVVSSSSSSFFLVVTIIPPIEKGERTIHALSIDRTQESGSVVVVEWRQCATALIHLRILHLQVRQALGHLRLPATGDTTHTHTNTQIQIQIHTTHT